MGCNINIDTSRPRPRPRPVFRKGGVTFIATLQDDFRANPVRSLTGRPCPGETIATATDDSQREGTITGPPLGYFDTSTTFSAVAVDLSLLHIDPATLQQIQGVDLGYDLGRDLLIPANTVYTEDDLTTSFNTDPVEGFVGLLDSYDGAAAAYSLRLLDKQYSGDAIRVRRDSDDAEQDIGFDSNGDLDVAGISSFCGVSNGYAVTWFDQSENGHHMTQSTT